MFVKISQFHSSAALVGYLLLQSAECYLPLLQPSSVPFCLSFLDNLHLEVILPNHELPEPSGSAYVLTFPGIGRSW